MRISIAEIKQRDLRFLSGKLRRIRELDNTETVVTRMREMGIASFRWKYETRAFDNGKCMGKVPHCREAEIDTHRPLIFHCTET
jgi:hypothetical protein